MNTKLLPRKPFANIAKTILFFLASYLIYTGCIKKTVDEEIDIKLDVSDTSLSFGYVGGEQKSFNIMTNYNWSVAKEAGATWLHFESATSGSINDGNNQNVIITVKADPNQGTALRTATITVSNDIPVVENKTISVTQAGLIPSLTVEPTSLSFSSSGGQQTLTINSNTSWKIDIKDSDDKDIDWLKNIPKTGEGNKTVTVTADSITGTTDRKAIIKVTTTNGAISHEIVVTQAAALPTPFLNVSHQDLPPFDAEGDDAYRTISVRQKKKPE